MTEIYRNLKAWMDAESVTDADCMEVLSLNATQWVNRLSGRVKFSALEKKVLAQMAKKDEAELFERG